MDSIPGTGGRTHGRARLLDDDSDGADARPPHAFTDGARRAGAALQ
jgi:hypothetical protein